MSSVCMYIYLQYIAVRFNAEPDISSLDVRTGGGMRWDVSAVAIVAIVVLRVEKDIFPELVYYFQPCIMHVLMHKIKRGIMHPYSMHKCVHNSVHKHWRAG